MSIPRDKYRTLWRYVFRSHKSSSIAIFLHGTLALITIALISSGSIALGIAGSAFSVLVATVFWLCSNKNYNGKDGCP